MIAKQTSMKDKTLFLQMDNTCAENKCWTVVKFCQLLVALGRVKRIQINFLPVGHTHIDIDQVIIFCKIILVYRVFRFIQYKNKVLEESSELYIILIAGV